MSSYATDTPDWQGTQGVQGGIILSKTFNTTTFQSFTLPAVYNQPSVFVTIFNGVTVPILVSDLDNAQTSNLAPLDGQVAVAADCIFSALVPLYSPPYNIGFAPQTGGQNASGTLVVYSSLMPVNSISKGWTGIAVNQSPTIAANGTVGIPSPFQTPGKWVISGSAAATGIIVRVVEQSGNGAANSIGGMAIGAGNFTPFTDEFVSGGGALTVQVSNTTAAPIQAAVILASGQ